MKTDNILYYQLGKGAEAFSAGRNAILPFHVIQGHQVHGDRIAVIDRPDTDRQELEGYDAFMTQLEGTAIGVRTADCVPILLYDPVREAVAAVHSGWRGTVLRISQKTIEKMESAFGCKAGDLHAVIGPAIGPDSFQVGEDVAAAFSESGFPMDEILSRRGEGDGTPMSGGLHIDLFRANGWLLEKAGLRKDAISVSATDTYTDLSFYSARREGTSCGRNINAIRLVPKH